MQNKRSLSRRVGKTYIFVMAALGAAVVGFVVGIAFAILIDDALGLSGGLWDTVTILIGVGCAVVAVRLVRLRARPRRPGSRHHHTHA